MMADKDIDSYLCEVIPLMDEVICVKPMNPRSMKAEDLAEACTNYCDICLSAENEAAVETAFKYISDNENSALVVCGSFYMASEIRPIILNKIN